VSKEDKRMGSLLLDAPESVKIPSPVTSFPVLFPSLVLSVVGDPACLTRSLFGGELPKYYSSLCLLFHHKLPQDHTDA